jgi:hypothetical protein
MKKAKAPRQKLPTGWTEKQVRELAQYYDNLTEDEQVAEIEAGLAKKGHTVMVVPTEFVSEIRKLISRKRPA